MTLAKTRDLVDHAVRSSSAVLAFNVITLEHAEAIVAGAQHANSGVILQVSENAIRFHNGQIPPIIAACSRIADDASVPVSVHFDHFRDRALTELAIQLAAGLGASSIMVDAAHLPYELNVRQTRHLTRLAHEEGLWVEAELGEIGGKDGAHAPGARTDPEEASAFVALTDVDGLAVAVGSSHAMTSQGAQLDVSLISAVRAGVGVPLVLHGSSGVGDEMLVEAVRAGIRKINVGTALNVSFTRELRRFLDAHLEVTDPRAYLKGGAESMARTVAHLCTIVQASPLPSH